MIALRLVTVEPEEGIIKVWLVCSPFAKVTIRKPGTRIGLACISAGFRGLAYQIIDWDFPSLEKVMKNRSVNRNTKAVQC